MSPLSLLLLSALSAAPRLVPVPALAKVRPGLPLETLAEARLRAARGECEGVQIYVAPPADVLSADVAPLRGPASGELPVRVYREGWMELTRATEGGGASGPWPDPLLPVHRSAGGINPAVLPARSTSERPLVLYLEVCVPAGLEPGTYRGQLTVALRDTPRSTLPLEVDVAPVDLPATSTLRNTWGLGVYVLAHGFDVRRDSPEGVALLRAAGRALLEHRLSGYGMGIDPLPSRPGPAGTRVVDFSGYDAEMSAVFDGTALPSGARATTAEVRDDRRLGTAERVAYLRAWQAHFAARRWPQLLWYYAKDEPTPEDDAQVRAEAALTQEVGGLPLLVTSFRSSLWASADLVAPVMVCLFPRPGRPICPGAEPPSGVRARLRPNQQLWWYQSCMFHGCEGPPQDPRLARSMTGWASYMIDHSGPRNRAMGVLAFLARIDGELYFDTLAAWEKDGQPWRDVWRFGGNGDGTFFYPGTRAQVGDEAPLLVPSLRLKTVRDGLEDFELLTLVAARRGRAAAEALGRRLALS
ncbi:MAG TPA: DUF4091 domain-containing protein [Myxococcaceae bacterium]|nr:DUF4091 domain-containing protein [Myxococcaceae bacterium]